MEYSNIETIFFIYTIEFEYVGFHYDLRHNYEKVIQEVLDVIALIPANPPMGSLIVPNGP